MPCNPDVLNITVCRYCQAGFGSKGDTDNATSVSYITKLNGSIMKGQISTNQCVVLKMLDKEPPLAQMWVETRWEYLHQHLEWYS